MPPILSREIFELGHTTPGKAPATEGNSDLRLDLKKRTLALMEGLELVCGDHNMPRTLIMLLYHQLIDHFKKIDILNFYGGSHAEFLKFKNRRKEPFTKEEEINILEAERVWVKECKFLLTFPMAKYLKNDPPEKPESGGFKPRGALKRWMKARLNAFNTKNTHLWYSWFQAKRACEPFSQDMVISLFNDHKEALSKEDPLKNNLESQAVANVIMNDKCFQYVLRKFKDDLRKRYYSAWRNDEEMTDRSTFKKWYEAPSNQNACWENSRSGGGKCSGLRSGAGLENEGNIYDKVIRSDRLFSMTFHHHSFLKGGIKKNFVEERFRNSDEDLWSSLGNRSIRNRNIQCLNSEVMDAWTMMASQADLVPKPGDETGTAFVKDPNFDMIAWYEENPPPRLRWGMGKRLNCRVACVLEPNKGRMVSKGEAVPYQMAKNMQICMLKCLQQFPCFKLTGRTFCPTDLFNLLERSKPDFLWHSVDYSAATDNISMEYSSLILNKIIRFLPSDLQDLARIVLGPHDISYPEKSGIGPFKQKNGQLMGSILSFPVLCLANLGLYLYCTSVWQKNWTFQERLNHVLVNGDDMLYSSPKSLPSSEGEVDLWERHVEIGKTVGLEMSIGKAYRHDVYCNINSTSVLYDLKRMKMEDHFYEIWSPKLRRTYKEKDTKSVLYGKGAETPRQIDFLNVGLILNKHKVLGRSDDEKKVAQDRIFWEKRRKMHLENGSDVWYELWLDHIYYDNFEGLDRGFSKLYAESHTHEDSRKGICENINLALSGCRDEKSRRFIMDFILHYHKNEIKRQTTFPIMNWKDGKRRRFLMIRNLFLPLSLGGMGVIPPLGYRFKVNPTQLDLADELRSRRPLWSVRPFPSGFNLIEEPRTVEMGPWTKPEKLEVKKFEFVNYRGRKRSARPLQRFFGALPGYSLEDEGDGRKYGGFGKKYSYYKPNPRDFDEVFDAYEKEISLSGKFLTFGDFPFELIKEEYLNNLVFEEFKIKNN